MEEAGVTTWVCEEFTASSRSQPIRELDTGFYCQEAGLSAKEDWRMLSHSQLNALWTHLWWANESATQVGSAVRGKYGEWLESEIGYFKSIDEIKIIKKK